MDRLALTGGTIIKGKYQYQPPTDIPIASDTELDQAFSILGEDGIDGGVNVTVQYSTELGLRGIDMSIFNTRWGMGVRVSSKGSIIPHISQGVFGAGERFVIAVDLHENITATDWVNNSVPPRMRHQLELSINAEMNAKMNANLTAQHCCTMQMAPCQLNVCSICCPGRDPKLLHASCGCGFVAGKGYIPACVCW